MLLRIASLMVVASCVAPAQVRISIVPATGQEISSATGNHWSLTGSTLKRAIAELFEITPTRIELPAELDDNKIYDFNIEVPPSKRTSMVTLMEQAIEKQFGISITRTRQLMEVYILTAPNGHGKLLSSLLGGEGSSVRIQNSGLHAHAVDLKTLSEALESPLALGRPVIDETHLTGHYDLSVRGIGHGPEALIQSLFECGIVAFPDKRNVELVVVRPNP
jgi:uncharacterized protein (TIGR03435 family)